MVRGMRSPRPFLAPVCATMMLGMALGSVGVSAFLNSGNILQFRSAVSGLERRTCNFGSNSQLRVASFPSVRARSTNFVSMALKNAAKIGKQIPLTWKEGVDYAKSTKFAVGDLVILLRSDGKLRYGEIVSQVGLAWQNSWEVAVSVAGDGSPTATRSEKSSSMWKVASVPAVTTKSPLVGSRSVPATQTLSKPPPAKPAQPPPTRVTRQPATQVRKPAASPPPTKPAKSEPKAAGAAPESFFNFFNQLSQPAKPAEAPEPPAPVAPPAPEPAANPLESLFGKIRPQQAAPEPPKVQAPPPKAPAAPKAEPPQAENPVSALFGKFSFGASPAEPPAAAPKAAPAAKQAPPSQRAAPAGGSKLVTSAPKAKPAAPPSPAAAPAAGAAGDSSNPVSSILSKLTEGSDSAASSVSSIISKISDEGSPVSSIISKVSEAGASAAKAAQSVAPPPRKPGDPDPAAAVAGAGKSALLGFLTGLSKVVDSIAEDDAPKPAAKAAAKPAAAPAAAKPAAAPSSAAAPAAAAAAKELPPTEKAKQLAGYKAVDDHVQSGMVVGLGTGSTAYYAVERVGQKLASGELKDVVCIPTSERTRQQAEALRIPLCTLDDRSELDVAIDGADAVDPNLALVKGGGGALLREKMVEVRAKRFICIVDDSKLCRGLGPSFPLPVEITPFCHLHTLREIAALPEVAGCRARLRTGDVSNNRGEGDAPAVTDNGNYIVDLSFDEPIADVRKAAYALKDVVGVVDHGIFSDLAYQVIVAGKDGSCRVAGRGGEAPWW